MIDFFKRHWWAILYSIVLTAFTIYLIMDTFVVARVYAAVPQTQSNVSGETNPAERQDSSSAADSTSISPASDADTVVSENSYRDDQIAITITEYREYDK